MYSYTQYNIIYYRTAENMILKLSSRGKGQAKVNDKITKLKKVNIISSIVRRGVKDPKSSTYIYLNTDVVVFSQLYKNNGSQTHQDLYDVILKEIKQMLNNKKSMKLNIIINKYNNKFKFYINFI